MSSGDTSESFRLIVWSRGTPLLFAYTHPLERMGVLIRVDIRIKNVKRETIDFRTDDLDSGVVEVRIQERIRMERQS